MSRTWHLEVDHEPRFPRTRGDEPVWDRPQVMVRGFPRTRGDEPYDLAEGEEVDEFSPHARG